MEHLYEKRGWYYIGVNIAGLPPQFALHTKDKDEAKKNYSAIRKLNKKSLGMMIA